MAVSSKGDELGFVLAGGFLRHLRFRHKVLLGCAVLLLPMLALLYSFSATVDRTIAAIERERCGLALDMPLRAALRSLDGLNAGARTDDAPPCTDRAAMPALRSAVADVTDRMAVARLAAPTRDEIALLRTRIADQSGLILDPELDTYYVVDVLFGRYPEGLALLDAPKAPDPAAIDAHRQRLAHALGTARGQGESQTAGWHTLAAATNDAHALYVAALETLVAADLPSNRAQAIAALHLLAEHAADWEDHALAARIAAHSAAKWRTYLVVAGVLLLACGYAWRSMYDSARRLGELARLAQRMARGEPIPTAPALGSDEIAELQQSFNAMAAQLREFYATLEARVDERTAAAQDAESRLRGVIESAPYGILLADSAGTIRLVNSQVEALFGYVRDELLGRKVEVLLPETMRESHAGHRSRFIAAPTARAMGGERAVRGRRKDGSEVPLEIGLRPVDMPDGTYVLAATIDISERLAAERKLRAAEAQATRSALLDELPLSVIATDTSGRIVNFNPAAEQLLGHNHGSLLGRPVLDMHDPDELGRHAHELSAQLARPIRPDFELLAAMAVHERRSEREWTSIRADGRRVPIKLSMSALRDADGTITGYLSVARDISAHKQATAYIDYLAQHDAMTGLPNRVLFFERLEAALRQAQARGTRVAMLLLDLDRFKQVNETFGHRTGDQLLTLVADRLEHAIERDSTVARLGADEFAVLLPDVADARTVAPLIEALQAAVAKPMSINGETLRVSVAIGACLSSNGDDAAALLRNADIAVNESKAHGSGGAVWFSSDMLHASREKLLLATALRKALEHEVLRLYYQPLISLRTGRIIGLEALLRWNHDGQDVSPERFVALAEESGLITQLGEWTLRRACRDCVALERRLERRLTVAVNVSPTQLLLTDWRHTVAAALDESGLHPNQLELEITESMLLEHSEERVDALRAIRELGVAVAVDDFGTGYSSLAYLTRLPLDKIKIDRSFVRNLPEHAADSAIVGAVLAMARHLGVRTIAEGVETTAQQDHLHAEGCDEVQGFLYSPALPPDVLCERFESIEAAVHLAPSPRAAQMGSAIDR